LASIGRRTGIAVVQERLAKICVDKLPMTVAEFGQFFNDDVATNLELVKARPRGCPSLRLLELEHELVDRLAARRLNGEVARILGVAPEIAFGQEPETSGFDLAAERALRDAM
jgi:hypothetical protein